MQGDVWIFMEFMLESLDMTSALLKTLKRRIPENVIGIIALSCLQGLHYLKKHLKVMHRGMHLIARLQARKPQQFLLARIVAMQKNCQLASTECVAQLLCTMRTSHVFTMCMRPSDFVDICVL